MSPSDYGLTPWAVFKAQLHAGALASAIDARGLRHKIDMLEKIADQPETARFSVYTAGGGAGAIYSNVQKYLCRINSPAALSGAQPTGAVVPGQPSLPIISTYFLVHPEPCNDPAGLSDDQKATFHRQVSEFVAGLFGWSAVVLDEIDGLDTAECLSPLGLKDRLDLLRWMAQAIHDGDPHVVQYVEGGASDANCPAFSIAALNYINNKSDILPDPTCGVFNPTKPNVSIGGGSSGVFPVTGSWLSLTFGNGTSSPLYGSSTLYSRPPRHATHDAFIAANSQLSLGHASFRLNPGSSKVVKLKLSKAGLALLKKRKTLSATLVTILAIGSKRATLTRTLTLTLPAKKSHKNVEARAAASGVSTIRGFFLGDTHFAWTANEMRFGLAVRRGTGLNYVVATQDNGLGPIPPPRGTAGIEWLCNPDPAGLGPAPTTIVPVGGWGGLNPDGLDGFVWTGTPGLSGGNVPPNCNGVTTPPGLFDDGFAVRLAEHATNLLGPGLHGPTPAAS